MMEVSDLTRDTRPTLKSILTNTIHDVIDLDKQKSNESGDAVEHENKTFYYRVIYLFMKRVVLFYTDKEVEEWCRRELLQETILPKIESYKQSNLT